jgi:hypothetical protein
MIFDFIKKFFGYSVFGSDAYKTINNLDLTEEDKNMIKKRYVKTVITAERDMLFIKIFFNLLSLWVTVGGVLIASLIILKESVFITDVGKEILFWVSWIFAFTISIANKSIGLFSLDKKHIYKTVYVENLKTEGWQFFMLTSKYSEYFSHSDAFRKFCGRIEKLIINTTSQNLGLDDDVSDKIFSTLNGISFSHNKDKSIHSYKNEKKIEDLRKLSIAINSNDINLNEIRRISKSINNKKRKIDNNEKITTKNIFNNNRKRSNSTDDKKLVHSNIIRKKSKKSNINLYKRNFSLSNHEKSRKSSDVTIDINDMKNIYKINEKK